MTIPIWCVCVCQHIIQIIVQIIVQMLTFSNSTHQSTESSWRVHETKLTKGHNFESEQPSMAYECSEISLSSWWTGTCYRCRQGYIRLLAGFTGLRAGAGSLSYIIHVDCCGLSTIVIKNVIIIIHSHKCDCNYNCIMVTVAAMLEIHNIHLILIFDWKHKVEIFEKQARIIFHFVQIYLLVIYILVYSVIYNILWLLIFRAG